MRRCATGTTCVVGINEFHFFLGILPLIDQSIGPRHAHRPSSRPARCALPRTVTDWVGQRFGMDTCARRARAQTRACTAFAMAAVWRPHVAEPRTRRARVVPFRVRMRRPHGDRHCPVPRARPAAQLSEGHPMTASIVSDASASTAAYERAIIEESSTKASGIVRILVSPHFTSSRAPLAPLIASRETPI